MREIERIDYLATLANGWLDGDGRAMTPDAVTTARTLAACVKPGLYSIYPRRCGGIQFEADGAIEFRIEASGDLVAEAI